MRVAVVSAKGGTSKTTTSVLLAEAAALGGRESMVVDLDGQQSGCALSWADLSAEDEPLRSLVTSLPVRELNRRLGDIAGERFVCIDSPPGDSAAIAAAIRVADLVVVPLQARLADLDRATTAIDLAAEYDVPAIAVLSRTRPRVKATGDIREALEAIGVGVAVTEVRESERIGDAYGQRPSEVTLRPFTALLAEIDKKGS